MLITPKSRTNGIGVCLIEPKLLISLSNILKPSASNWATINPVINEKKNIIKPK
jgi:hypothetical protein